MGDKVRITRQGWQHWQPVEIVPLADADPAIQNLMTWSTVQSVEITHKYGATVKYERIEEPD